MLPFCELCLYDVSLETSVHSHYNDALFATHNIAKFGINPVKLGPETTRKHFSMMQTVRLPATRALQCDSPSRRLLNYRPFQKYQWESTMQNGVKRPFCTGMALPAGW